MVAATEKEPLLPAVEAIKRVTGKRYCRQTAYRWIEAKKLNAVKVGHAWLTSTDEVRRMINRNTQEAMST